ncbi:(R)-mandelonitrile lyase-like protein [Tanacetum coccineum]
MMTCSCRAWQLSGIPCQHGCAAIYFMHKDPEDYISDWYGKHMFVSAYSTYIEGMNGMDQWPTTKYTKPLPLVVKKMPGRPPHKRKRDACEKDDGNRTRSCPIKGDGEGSASGSQGVSGSSVRGGKTTRGGRSARDGRSARGGGSARVSSTSSSSVRGGKTTRGGGSASGSQSDRGGQGGFRTRRGGSQGSAQDSAQGSAHGSASVGGSQGSASGIQGSASGIQGSQVFKRVNGKAVRQRGRDDGSKSSAYPHGIRPIGYGVSWDIRPIDGETMVGNMQGIPVPTWPYDGSPADLLGADEIPLIGTQPMASQDPIDEPVPNVPAPNQPALNVPTLIMRRESERIKMIKFSKPVSPRPGLTLEDAMLVE